MWAIFEFQICFQFKIRRFCWSWDFCWKSALIQRYGKTSCWLETVWFRQRWTRLVFFWSVRVWCLSAWRLGNFWVGFQKIFRVIGGGFLWHEPQYPIFSFTFSWWQGTRSSLCYKLSKLYRSDCFQPSCAWFLWYQSWVWLSRKVPGFWLTVGMVKDSSTLVKRKEASFQGFIRAYFWWRFWGLGIGFSYFRDLWFFIAASQGLFHSWCCCKFF